MKTCGHCGLPVTQPHATLFECQRELIREIGKWHMRLESVSRQMVFDQSNTSGTVRQMYTLKERAGTAK